MLQNAFSSHTTHESTGDFSPWNEDQNGKTIPPLGNRETGPKPRQRSQLLV
jgi:hypothetical protein